MDFTLKSNIPVGVYEHFKGNRYEVIGTAFDSETMEEVVVYKALYPPYALFTRKAAMFLETVDKPDVPYTGPRFKLITKK